MQQCNTKNAKKPFTRLEIIVNTTCDNNCAILITQNKKVQYSSGVTLNSTILKY